MDKITDEAIEAMAEKEYPIPKRYTKDVIEFDEEQKSRRQSYIKGAKAIRELVSAPKDEDKGVTIEGQLRLRQENFPVSAPLLNKDAGKSAEEIIDEYFGKETFSENGREQIKKAMEEYKSQSSAPLDKEQDKRLTKQDIENNWDDYCTSAAE